MAMGLVEDFNIWVAEAQKYYRDSRLFDYEFVIAQDLWTKAEAICYLIGIDPKGNIVSKLKNREFVNNDGQFDENLAEINIAFESYNNLIDRAIDAGVLRVIQGVGNPFVFVEELFNWALKKQLYIDTNLLDAWKVIHQEIVSVTGTSITKDQVSRRRELQHV